MGRDRLNTGNRTLNFECSQFYTQPISRHPNNFELDGGHATLVI